MTQHVSVRQHTDSDTVVTVTETRAAALGLDVLDQPAVDKRGIPLGPRPYVAPASALRGAELDAALEEAGLSKSGKVADKQARLAAHQTDITDPAAAGDSEES